MAQINIIQILDIAEIRQFETWAKEQNLSFWK